MFEVGKRYNFVTIERGDETSWTGRVIAVDGPLIKIQMGDNPPTVINTTSPFFVSATEAKQK